MPLYRPEGAYNLNEWTAFREEKDIIWEPIILGNQQQNGSAEGLSQTLLQKTPTIFENNDLDVKYWPKMIYTTNYLRNCQIILNKSFTLFEASYNCRL